MAQRHFRLIEKRDCHVVLFGKDKIGTITNKGMKILFGGGSISKLVSNVVVEKKNQVRKKSKVSEIDETLLTAATQLLNAYNKEKKAFYKNKNLKDLDAESSEFRFFIEAAMLVQRHDVSNKEFLKAQIVGLKFVNNGKGTFPKPNQLVTVESENRLAEYLRKDFGEGGDEVEVILDYKDKTTSLQENTKYQTARTKLMMEQATMWDAIYVKKCQLARRGKCDPFIDKYIAKLKEEKKVDGEV